MYAGQTLVVFSQYELCRYMYMCVCVCVCVLVHTHKTQTNTHRTTSASTTGRFACRIAEEEGGEGEEACLPPRGQQLKSSSEGSMARPRKRSDRCPQSAM